eukprot:TRINITY_DN2816_c0_g1_i1.p1 TRINITY_DN2816_c0_g1~~TRINITY_DN2816_c0_g1_i1.p1  ORF type:complete len:532 (+),score=88.65 TRINITY_DN2816_c0_g1_i1:25-1596(+)
MLAPRLWCNLWCRAARGYSSPAHDVAHWLKTHKIEAEPASGSSLQVMTEWNAEGLHFPTLPPKVMEYFLGKGIERPTPIQAIALPAAVAGSDVLGISQTGSGKTLSYALPLIVQLAQMADASDGKFIRGPRGLIVVPTRELAQQVESEVLGVAAAFFPVRGKRISVLKIHGGTSVPMDVNRLATQPTILVATPGRINDMLKRDALKLTQCKYLVVDEADRMLDMGFMPQLTELMGYLPKDRQTTLWSATWPKAIQKFAAEVFTNQYTKIFVGGDKGHRLNPSVRHHFVALSSTSEKVAKLMAIYNDRMAATKEFSQTGNTGGETPAKPPRTRFLAFVNTKLAARDLTQQLYDAGVPCAALHGDLTQARRDEVLRSFRSCDKGVLIATDVAARGIDIADIDVVHFDMPTTTDSFVHRSGRTARGKSDGDAWSLVTPEDASVLQGLLVVFEDSDMEPPSELVTLANQSQEVPHRSLNEFTADSTRRYSKQRHFQPHRHGNTPHPKGHNRARSPPSRPRDFGDRYS